MPDPTVSHSGLSATHPAADEPTRERKGYLSVQLIMNQHMDKVSHKGTSNYCFHCWYFHRVSLQGFAQRRTVHPGRQDLLGSLLFPASGPQNSRDPRRGGKAEIPQMIFSPCRWAQREHWSPGMASRSQTQSLSPSARYSAFTATPQPYFDCEV